MAGLLGNVAGVFENLGPYAAGAATVVVPAFVPLPALVRSTLGVVPPAVLAGAAGYMSSPLERDQACAVLKGVAGGVGAAMILQRLV